MEEMEKMEKMEKTEETEHTEEKKATEQREKPRKLVYLIGTGPGGDALITEEARKALLESSFVLGSPRLLDSCARFIGKKPARPVIDPRKIIDRIAQGDYPVWAVLFSGDTGAYSGAARLVSLAREQPWEMRTLSGISSWSYFAARLGRSWDEERIVSLHGREVKQEDLLGYAARNSATFFLTDPRLSAEYICRTLAANGMGDLRVTVGERLSYPDERITEGTAAVLGETAFNPLNVVLVENPRVREYPCGAVPDRDFLRDGSPLTKEEIRSIALGKMRLQDRSVAYDIGAGSGSVACEMALRARHGRIFAVERNPSRLDLITRNSRQLGLYHVRVVSGSAPEALAGLPPPDQVFIGGSSGNLASIIETVRDKNPRLRLVITAVSLETLTESLALLKEGAFEDIEITQASISKAVKRGDYYLMEGANPVYIISATGTVGND
ncbi:MAG: precorrin-6y C5,15-methyltransferase (decarboxylating) subunit CbiE [Spirochaetaceae bacterium]|jgi:precorrin-6Y C5,15-methyltransferase (decarboxylating)|nr:precorrin-6y C5,15-methyltransferase (decarboxylating) subunit CbiE [Spirochaetaceae bacterium]